MVAARYVHGARNVLYGKTKINRLRVISISFCISFTNIVCLLCLYLLFADNFHLFSVVRLHHFSSYVICWWLWNERHTPHIHYTSAPTPTSNPVPFSDGNYHLPTIYGFILKFSSNVDMCVVYSVEWWKELLLPVGSGPIQFIHN